MNEIFQWVAIAATFITTVISIALSLRQEAYFDREIRELETRILYPFEHYEE